MPDRKLPPLSERRHSTSSVWSASVTGVVLEGSISYPSAEVDADPSGAATPLAVATRRPGRTASRRVADVTAGPLDLPPGSGGRSFVSISSKNPNAAAAVSYKWTAPRINIATLEFVRAPELELRYKLRDELHALQRSSTGTIIVCCFIIGEVMAASFEHVYWHMTRFGVLALLLLGGIGFLHTMTRPGTSEAEAELEMQEKGRHRRLFTPIGIGIVYLYQILSAVIVELSAGYYLSDRCAGVRNNFLMAIFALQTVWQPAFKLNLLYSLVTVVLWGLVCVMRNVFAGDSSGCADTDLVIYCVVVSLASTYAFEYAKRSSFLTTVGLQAEAEGLGAALHNTAGRVLALTRTLAEERAHMQSMMLSRLFHAGGRFGAGSSLVGNLLAVVEGVLAGKTPSDEVLSSVKRSLVDTANQFEPSLAAALSENLLDPTNKATISWLRGTLMRPKARSSGATPLDSPRARNQSYLKTIHHMHATVTMTPYAPTFPEIPAEAMLEADEGEGKLDADRVVNDADGSQCSSQSPSPPAVLALLQRKDVQRVLDEMGSWNLDAFALADLTDGHPLATLGFALFEEHGLLTALRLPRRAFHAFLLEVEAGYQENPYHNRTHAADVLASLHMLLTRGGVRAAGYLRPSGGASADASSGAGEGESDALALAAALLAAILHDYGHAGLNNDFLMKTLDPIALKHNDRSVLENHHVAEGWALLDSPRFALLAEMPASQRRALRAQLIQMILATDLKSHFEYLSQFQDTFEVRSNGDSAGTSGRGGGDATIQRSPTRTGVSAGGAVSRSDGIGTEEDETPPPRPRGDRVTAIVLQVALKCADLGHVSRPRDLHARWVGCLQDECWQQGDQERARGLPVSPMNDRLRPISPAGQVGFFDIVALPLFRSWTAAFPDSQPFAHGVEDNYEWWQGAAAAGLQVPQGGRQQR